MQRVLFPSSSSPIIICLVGVDAVILDLLAVILDFFDAIEILFSNYLLLVYRSSFLLLIFGFLFFRNSDLVSCDFSKFRIYSLVLAGFFVDSIEFSISIII